jgi:hypothetical protein
MVCYWSDPDVMPTKEDRTLPQKFRNSKLPNRLRYRRNPFGFWQDSVVCTGVPILVALTGESFGFECIENRYFHFRRFINSRFFVRMAMRNGHCAKTWIFSWTFRWSFDRGLRFSESSQRRGGLSDRRCARSGIARFSSAALGGDF